jgi:hypothetical protein
VGPRAGLDTEVRVKILCLCRVSNLDRPVVQPIARLSYSARLTIPYRSEMYTNFLLKNVREDTTGGDLKLETIYEYYERVLSGFIW